MCADHGAIDDRRYLVDVDLELAKDLRPSVLPGPIREAVVDRFPRTKSLGQVTPRNAHLCAKHDGVDEQSVAARRLAT
jgi:hypothetical protein